MPGRHGDVTTVAITGANEVIHNIRQKRHDQLLNAYLTGIFRLDKLMFLATNKIIISNRVHEWCGAYYSRNDFCRLYFYPWESDISVYQRVLEIVSILFLKLLYKTWQPNIGLKKVFWFIICSQACLQITKYYRNNGLFWLVYMEYEKMDHCNILAKAEKYWIK